MTEKQNRMILITLPGDFSGYYSQCSNRGPGTHGEALPLDMYTFARTRPISRSGCSCPSAVFVRELVPVPGKSLIRNIF